MYLTEIKDLEGLANSLANMEQLDKEHHDNIAAKLEQDLLKHFKISKDDENTIKTEADSLLRDSEKYYVKGRLLHFYASTAQTY